MTSVRFVVNGYELETTEETIRYVPGTYLTWLLDNCREDVIHGRAIELKTSPNTFCNLIRRLSYLREHRVKIWTCNVNKQSLGSRLKRRKAMEPGPITFTSTQKPHEYRREVCKIATPLPTHATDLSSSVDFLICAIREILTCLSSWPTFFDKVVFLLTIGRTPSGSPLLWPYLFHLFNSKTSEASSTVHVKNQETSAMNDEELDALCESVNLSSMIQHEMKAAMRQRGYTCVFSDMKIDMNNFYHWRIARSTDYGVRFLDDQCTVRCLVVNVQN